MSSTENPWRDRTPRTAAEWVDHDLHFAQLHADWTSEHLGELVDGGGAALARNTRLEISGWTNVYLWEALRRYAPHVADRVADDIADICEAGEAMGEWLWEWQRQHKRGEDLQLPFEFEMALLADTPTTTEENEA